MITLDADKKIAKAKTYLILKHPFYGSTLLSSVVREDNTVQTMATDGSSIFWNRAFVDSITEQEVVGVFAHEVLHILFKHALRMRGRVHQLWNIACDYAINHILKRGDFTLPEGALFKDEYSTFTAETIYNKIRKDMSEPPEPPTKGKGDEGDDGQSTPSDGQGNPQDQGNQPSESGGGSAPQPQGWGEVIEPKKADGSALSESEYKLAEADADHKLLNATQHRSRGDIPSELHGIIDQLLEPKVSWHDQFDQFIKGGDNRQGWTEKKYNVIRHRTTGVLDPVVDRKGVGHIVVAQDQSGSVHDKELVRGFTELNYLCEDLKPESVTVIPFDASVNKDKVQFFDQGEEVEKINIKGRGGTCVQPVFDFIEETGIEVDRLIIFTDMGIFDYPKVAPDYPVLWVNVSPTKSEAPFGQTIRVDQ